MTTATTSRDLVWQLLDVWATSLHHMSAADFAHEQERVEYLQRSPMADRMRTAVDNERAARNGGDTHA